MIDLQILATELNLTCLIEVHDMDNLMRVRDHVIGFPHRSYSLLGINNRDLRTFKVDLANTLRLADLVEDRSVLVSESGIRSREDVIKLSSVGVRAVLVGETLMRSDDVAGTMRELFAPIPKSDHSE
jgi:indole-3-glycerol phosphate synthase